MNYYTLLGTGVKTRKEYKALLLMFLTSPDFDVDFNAMTGEARDVALFNINAHLPFSLSNLNADKSQLINPVYLTEHQGTEEGFDKPIIETFDIVLAVTTRNDVDLGKYYDDYARFDLGWVNDNGVTQTVYIGTSNSSKSDFNDPFADADLTVVASQKSLGDLLINQDLID